jgi:hypothetical protein
MHDAALFAKEALKLAEWLIPHNLACCSMRIGGSFGMKTISRVAAILAGASGFAAGAAEAKQLSNPAATIANFDVASMAPLLTEMGVAWQKLTRDDGSRHILMTVEGLNIDLAPVACRSANGTNCAGLQIVALFEGHANPQTLSAFDMKYAFTSSGALSNAPIFYLSRYEIADYGVQRGNIEASLANFVYIAKRFRSEMAASGETVSKEGFADDMSASALNGAAARKSGAMSPAANDLAARHRAELEGTPELVRMLSSLGGGKRLNRIAPPAKK